jgi:predicted dienelactone hydrolase
VVQVSLANLFVWVTALGAILLPGEIGQAGTTNEPEFLEVAGLDVAVWPPAGSQATYPLVLFSHGIGGCKTQSTYLMRALADHGMLVVAPDHQDKGSNCPKQLPTLAEVAEKFPGLHEDRRDDFEALRAALPADPNLSQWPIDPDRVVLIGHSLGGYTVLGLAGAWPDWDMGKIAAVVGLAPYSRPFLTDGKVETISVPVLLQSGGNDVLTPARNQDQIFAGLKAPACKVTYAGADHFAWTDIEPTEFHDATAAATIAFLDEVFAGRPLDEAALAQPGTDQRQECKN